MAAQAELRGVRRQRRFFLGLFLCVNAGTCLATFRPWASLRAASSLLLLPACAAATWLAVRLLLAHSPLQRRVAFQFIPDWQKALLVGSTALFLLYLSYHVHWVRTLTSILVSWFLLHTASQFTARVRDEESYSAKPARVRFAAFEFPNPTPRLLRALQPAHEPVATEEVRKKLDFGMTGLLRRRPATEQAAPMPIVSRNHQPPAAPQSVAAAHVHRTDRERIMHLPRQAATPFVPSARPAMSAGDVHAQHHLLSSAEFDAIPEYTPQQEQPQGQKRRHEEEDAARHAPSARIAPQHTADLFTGLRQLVDTAVKSTKRGLESLVSESPATKKSAKQDESTISHGAASSRTRKEPSSALEQGQPSKKANVDRANGDDRQSSSKDTDIKRKASNASDQGMQLVEKKKAAMDDGREVAFDLTEMMRPSKYAINLYSKLVRGKHRKQEHTVVDPWDPLQSRWAESGSTSARRRQYRPLLSDREEREKQSLEIAKEVFGGVKPAATTAKSASTTASAGVASTSLPSSGFSLSSSAGTTGAAASTTGLSINLKAIDGSSAASSTTAALAASGASGGFKFGGAAPAPAPAPAPASSPSSSEGQADGQGGSTGGRPPFSPPTVPKFKDAASAAGIATRASDKPDAPALTNVFAKPGGDSAGSGGSAAFSFGAKPPAATSGSGSATGFSFGGSKPATEQPAAPAPAPAPADTNGAQPASGAGGFSFGVGGRPRSSGIISDGGSDVTSTAAASAQGATEQNKSSSAVGFSGFGNSSNTQADAAPKTAFKIMSESSSKPPAPLQFGAGSSGATNDKSQQPSTGFSGLSASSNKDGGSKPVFGQPAGSNTASTFAFGKDGTQSNSGNSAISGGSGAGFAFGGAKSDKPGAAAIGASGDNTQSKPLSGFAPAKPSGKSVSFAPQTSTAAEPSKTQSGFGAQSTSIAQGGNTGGFAFGNAGANQSQGGNNGHGSTFAFGGQASSNATPAKDKPGAFAFGGGSSGTQKPAQAQGAFAFGSGGGASAGGQAQGGVFGTNPSAAKPGPAAFGSSGQQSTTGTFGSGQQNQGGSTGVFGTQQASQPTGAGGFAFGSGGSSGQPAFGGGSKPGGAFASGSKTAPAAAFGNQTGQAGGGGMKFGGASSGSNFGAQTQGQKPGGAPVFGQSAGGPQSGMGGVFGGQAPTSGGMGGGGAPSFAFGSAQAGAPLTRTSTVNVGMGAPAPAAAPFGGGGMSAPQGQVGFSLGAGGSKAPPRRRTTKKK